MAISLLGSRSANTFESHRGGFTTADTQRSYTPAQVVSRHGVKQGHDDASARGADWMS
jgi:hypothetical protein